LLLSNEAADVAIKKLASGAEEFSSMREYVHYLFSKFDYNNDGKIHSMSSQTASAALEST